MDISYIPRQIGQELKEMNGKAKIILGPRQTGKTTLLHHIFDGDKRVLWYSGDEPDDVAQFEGVTSTRLKAMFGDSSTVIIDEAQKIPDIGTKIKLITDNIKNVNIIATGSSSFELTNRISETLTGRKREYHLFPISFAEMSDHLSVREEKRLLPNRLVYGYYPEVVTSPGKEREVLGEIINSYLFKDILMWNRIQKSDKLLKLLQALAFQAGREVSYNELGRITELKNDTVESYITILERAFIIFRLPAFSRNLRKELKRSRKIFFYDNGVRNALISNFKSIELRDDVGQLWENYLVSERIKQNSYKKRYCNSYFWRTTDQQEIDYIEESDGKLLACEFKWGDVKKVKIPKIFEETYPDSSSVIINKDNFGEFIGN
ncbi:MAG: ATP-binding protein [Candidatus Delongbacteria bacterium]|nr:ATP-binding protein [Candidatus Delongbacteria bacterium]